MEPLIREMIMKIITERREVRSAVSAYWKPPFLGTLIIWVMAHRMKSIHDMAAAKENPPTMELRVWVCSSWVTRSTVARAVVTADYFIYYTRENYSGKRSSFSTNFLKFFLFLSI